MPPAEASQPSACSPSPSATGGSGNVGTGTRIDVRDLTVQAGDRVLLKNANATFPAGEVILLLGCSGVGKSVLLRILAGLIDAAYAGIRYSGSISFVKKGEVTRSEGDATHPVAVVFQSFALLDELSPLQNVQIALDHANVAKKTTQNRASQLLEELRVPTDRPTSVLSGGQQQRLAIARAIAPDTDVILYDEPTSGLDTNTSYQVADLIRETQLRYQRTSILVTHDYQTLSRIADRIILLDHEKQALIEVPKERWGQLSEALGTPPDVGAIAAGPTLQKQISGGVLNALSSTGQFVEDIFCLPWCLMPLWRSFKWGVRYTGYYLMLVAGPSACVYIAVAGMILGFVAQDFVFRYLPYRQFTEPLLTENLLHATGFSLYRFLVPILATILIAARSGAAVASDIGIKVYGNQLDAMKTLGINPYRTLRTPILYAFLIGTPFLTFLSYATAAITASFAFLMTHSDLGIGFWDAHFHKELILPKGVFYKGTAWLMAKLLTCGAGIAILSWRCGTERKLSGTDISHGVTRTILWATLFVLFVHFAYSLFEFKGFS